MTPPAESEPAVLEPGTLEAPAKSDVAVEAQPKESSPLLVGSRLLYCSEPMKEDEKRGGEELIADYNGHVVELRDVELGEKNRDTSTLIRFTVDGQTHEHRFDSSSVNFRSIRLQLGQHFTLRRVKNGPDSELFMIWALPQFEAGPAAVADETQAAVTALAGADAISSSEEASPEAGGVEALAESEEA